MRKTLELTDWFLVHDDHGHVEEIVETTEIKWYQSKKKGGEDKKVAGKKVLHNPAGHAVDRISDQIFEIDGEVFRRT